MAVSVTSTRIEPDIVVLKIIGNITVGGDASIGTILKAVLDDGVRKIIFDLSGVEHLDSSGVETMFECYSLVKKSGGELRYAAAGKRVARLFSITRLDTVLSFCSTVEDAAGSFPAG